MLNRFFARQYDPEAGKRAARGIGTVLVVVGALGFILDAVSAWVSVLAFVVGVACVVYGSSGKT